MAAGIKRAPAAAGAQGPQPSEGQFALGAPDRHGGRSGQLTLNEYIGTEPLKALQGRGDVGRGLLAEELESAGAEELEGMDPGCGGHGRRSEDPEAGRVGSRGSPA